MGCRRVVDGKVVRRDISGQKFGRLLVCSFSHMDSRGRLFWNCTCDCGKNKVVQGSDIEGGRSRSCGCTQREAARKRLTSHGLTGTRTYRIWAQMIQRCRPERGYDRYGVRGIRVCERWMLFENFLDDMGECPGAFEIDRVDNNGNYEPGNCRWVSRKENQRNTNRSAFLTLNGETKTMVEWSELMGIQQGTILARLKRGWTVEMAITRPVRGKVK